MSKLRLATFRVEVTPPLGHPLCSGWIKPAEGITDPLFACGVALISDTDPVVLCAIDWCEINNEDHILWRGKLAAAANTVADRVAVQCVHQHDAPWPDRVAEALISQQDGLQHLMDVAWCDAAIERVAGAVRAALQEAKPITHVEVGQAKVEMIASNRRPLGPNGKVLGVRWTACKDPAIRAEPEGVIDPYLKTISFWNGAEKLAALHYYAVHPCSYYGDGMVNADFVGIARQRRNAEDAGAMHIYFNGCGGNITAGKYNDGARSQRAVLAERLYRAMVASEQRTERIDVDRCEWRTRWVALPPRPDMNEPDLLRMLTDSTVEGPFRTRAAMMLSYLRRFAAGITIPFTTLAIGGKLCILHLPGEAFIEYQLLAQELRPEAFVAVASYGDCGPGYITLARSFDEGGYEPTDAFVGPAAEAAMRDAIKELMS